MIVICQTVPYRLSLLKSAGPEKMVIVKTTCPISVCDSLWSTWGRDLVPKSFFVHSENVRESYDRIKRMGVKRHKE